MKRYLLFNIGCIECGVSSNIVGVYKSEALANEHAKKLDDVCGWREGGQNHFEVFPLPEDGVITEEYRDALATIDSEAVRAILTIGAPA